MANQQHHLVYAVGRAVKAFRQHGRTARRNSDDKLHNGDGGVADQRGIDNLFIAVFFHFSISIAGGETKILSSRINDNHTVQRTEVVFTNLFVGRIPLFNIRYYLNVMIVRPREVKETP